MHIQTEKGGFCYVYDFNYLVFFAVVVSHFRSFGFCSRSIYFRRKPDGKSTRSYQGRLWATSLTNLPEQYSVKTALFDRAVFCRERTYKKLYSKKLLYQKLSGGSYRHFDITKKVKFSAREIELSVPLLPEGFSGSKIHRFYRLRWA